MTSQLELFDPGMPDEEREAVVADFLGRYSAEVTTTGAPAAKFCRCEPHGIGHFDQEASETRCVRCGRRPGLRSDEGPAATGPTPKSSCPPPITKGAAKG
jgi:hypothetical protein